MIWNDVAGILCSIGFFTMVTVLWYFHVSISIISRSFQSLSNSLFSAPNIYLSLFAQISPRTSAQIAFSILYWLCSAGKILIYSQLFHAGRMKLIILMSRPLDKTHFWDREQHSYSSIKLMTFLNDVCTGAISKRSNEVWSTQNTNN